MHDEVAYRHDRPAQNPDVMGRRIGSFIRDFGSHPAFLRIDGQPAVAFRFWNRFRGNMDLDELRGMIDKAEAIAGEPIYWIVHSGPQNDLLEVEGINALITMANSNSMMERVSGYGEPYLDWDQMAEQHGIWPTGAAPERVSGPVAKAAVVRHRPYTADHRVRALPADAAARSA